MAALRQNYVFCPLLSRSTSNKFFGVRQDKDNETLLVSLGKNIIIKYKLSDQKALRSWSTQQNYGLSYPAVYDEQRDEYVGVFNDKCVSTWSQDTESLDRVKKHKFSSHIFSVLALGSRGTFLVYNKGYAEHLSDGLAAKKITKFALLKGSERLQSCEVGQLGTQAFLVLFIVRRTQDYWVRVAEIDEKNRVVQDSHRSIQLIRESHDLQGYCVLYCEQKIRLLTVWSDGTVYSRNLLDSDEFCCGHPLFSISGINIESPIAMTALDCDHIAVYGMREDKEGGELQLWDIQFGVQVSRQRMKLYEKMPSFSAVSSQLFLPQGQTLVTVPYILAPSTVASITGKRSGAMGHECLGSWLWAISENEEMKLHKIEEDISSYDTEALTLPCSMLSVQSEEGLYKLYQTLLLTENIPESALVSTISFILSCDDNQVDNVQFEDIEEQIGYLHMLPSFYDFTANSDIICVDEENTDSAMENCSFQCKLKPVLGRGKLKFVNAVLQVPYTDIFLIRSLQNLSFADACVLLQHLHWLLRSIDVLIEEVQQCVLGWAGLVIDAHFQHFVLVNDVRIYEFLAEFSETVNSKVKAVEDMCNLQSLVDGIRRNTVFQNKGTQPYSVDVLYIRC